MHHFILTIFQQCNSTCMVIVYKCAQSTLKDSDSVLSNDAQTYVKRRDNKITGDFYPIDEVNNCFVSRMTSVREHLLSFAQFERVAPWHLINTRIFICIGWHQAGRISRFTDSWWHCVMRTLLATASVM